MSKTSEFEQQGENVQCRRECVGLSRIISQSGHERHERGSKTRTLASRPVTGDQVSWRKRQTVDNGVPEVGKLGCMFPLFLSGATFAPLVAMIMKRMKATQRKKAVETQKRT